MIFVSFGNFFSIFSEFKGPHFIWKLRTPIIFVYIRLRKQNIDLPQCKQTADNITLTTNKDADSNDDFVSAMYTGCVSIDVRSDVTGSSRRQRGAVTTDLNMVSVFLISPKCNVPYFSRIASTRWTVWRYRNYFWWWVWFSMFGWRNISTNLTFGFWQFGTWHESMNNFISFPFLSEKYWWVECIFCFFFVFFIVHSI